MIKTILILIGIIFFSNTIFSKDEEQDKIIWSLPGPITSPCQALVTHYKKQPDSTMTMQLNEGILSFVAGLMYSNKVFFELDKIFGELEKNKVKEIILEETLNYCKKNKDNSYIWEGAFAAYKKLVHISAATD